MVRFDPIREIREAFWTELSWRMRMKLARCKAEISRQREQYVWSPGQMKGCTKDWSLSAGRHQGKSEVLGRDSREATRGHEVCVLWLSRYGSSGISLVFTNCTPLVTRCGSIPLHLAPIFCLRGIDILFPLPGDFSLWPFFLPSCILQWLS